MLTRQFYRYVVIPAFETVYKRRKTLQYWKQLERSQWWSPDQLQAEQFAALQRLLRHAAENCPYYRQLWAERLLEVRDIQSPADFNRWPLLQREHVLEHRSALRAEHGASPLISKATGGSTGIPMHFDLDQGSYERRNAATFRGYGWAGATPGTKQFYLWGAPLDPQPASKIWKNRFYEAVQRRRVVNSFELSEETVPRILRSLNSYRPDVIVAYTNAVYHFARSLAERKERPFSPQSIIVGAEKLHGFQRELIESVFRAPVFETYGSREFMLMGAECSEHAGLHLTTEQLYLEIVNDDGTPTPAGEVGNVVVTDLYNYGMPFVRYASGDQAVAGFSQCRCGRGLPLLHEVRGRKLDVLRTPDGRSLPGEFFPHLMKDYGWVRQFQVVQPAMDQLELRVVLGPTWNESDQAKLLQCVQQTVGPMVHITWQPVSEIPLTRAGKHRVVVSHVPDPASTEVAKRASAQD